MKNTKFIICALLLIFSSVDAFSQLRPATKSSSGNDGHDANGQVFTNDWLSCRHFDSPYFIESEICLEIEVTTTYLDFDDSNPDENGCSPVSNFGCDLHIGASVEGTSDITYMQITSCEYYQILQSNASYDPEDDVRTELMPKLCFPIPDIDGICDDGGLNFSLDLYCKDAATGTFTLVSELATLNPDQSWWTLLAGDPKVNEVTDYVFIECCEGSLDPITLDPTQNELQPFIGQTNDGNTILIDKVPTIEEGDIELKDQNYQSINLTGKITRTGDDSFAIDISTVNPGIYYIMIRGEGEIFSSTVVKM